MIRMKEIVSFLLILLLAGVELVWAAGGGEGGSHGVTPTQLKNLFWFTLNFIVLVVILYKFARKPVVNMFKSRQENILRQYNELLEKKREAEAKYLELQEKVKNLEKEAQAIYENYVAQGLKEKERIIEEANLQAERIKQQTELYIQQEIEKAKNMLREEVAEAAVKLAEDLLRKSITEEDQKKIYKEFINEIRGRVVH
ncbi:MAG: ATP synthase subunit b [Thermodesulfobacterium commune]|nr:MAG: ATP synthase subunit b [Thermodesulfobacterium commune]